MGRKCNVESCQSDSNRPQDVGVTFHKVPPHLDIRPKWLSLCRIPEDKKFVKVLYVCSRHFLRADFCNFKGKKYMLKQGVLPSVFPWDKSKLEAIKAEAKKEKPVHIKEEPVDDNTATPDTKQELPSDSIKQEVLDSEKINSSSNEKNELKEDPVTSTKLVPSNSISISFSINSRVEALDFNNEWFPAKIIEIDYDENEVLIHFENYSSKYDEWISMDSSRLRPLQNADPKTETSKIDDAIANIDPNPIIHNVDKKPAVMETYVVGERCLATWSNSRKFPATVTKVLENNSYEVLFDDGFVKTAKAKSMSKTQGKPIQSSPLFDPIKSSKQDRREKKRKLNVAALFRKRPKLETSPDKVKKIPSNTVANVQSPLQAQTESPIEQDMPIAQPSPIDIENWKPSWYKGKPVGIESTLHTQDGPKVSYIVPDPRIPPGWNKHILRRTKGCDAGKWDTIIVSPENKRFRSKTEILRYIEEHPNENLNEKMFDFSFVMRRKRKNPALTTPTKSPEKEKPPPLITPEEPVEQPEVKNDKEEKDDEDSNGLKILFEDDAYKCPIEGCGKNFRRENLAQMHVKHYHPEYTKFLDSTPNVADLAYARTVGENLDRSPEEYDCKPENNFLRPQKPPFKTAPKSLTPKTSKHSASDLEDMPELKPEIKPKSILVSKSKDQEIIKLLNAKPYNKQEESNTQQQNLGNVSLLNTDIKHKDSSTKSDSVPKREIPTLKSLLKNRTFTGIKTLLPVHRTKTDNSPAEKSIEEHYKPPSKRKSAFADTIEIIKGTEKTETPPLLHPISTPTPTKIKIPSSPPTHQQPLQQTLSSSLTLDPPILTPQIESSPSSNPNPPFNNIIIEGGEVIKIVRMKQEEIINCTCGFTEEDGLMIQCELCLCWQHAYCNNIERESQVPEKYVCYICQNPFRERLSRKYYHDQDWLTKGVLPVGSYHTRDDDALQKRFDRLKKCHDLSGGLMELGHYQHSLKIKMKIAEAKNHPKLYLWSKPWSKKCLPEKAKPELEDAKPKVESEVTEFLKNDFDVEKESQNENSMLMMLLKDGKNVMSKLDLNTLMDNTPIIPQPEAIVDSADCRLNLLEHLVHEYSLVEERLDSFERQLSMLEETVNVERDIEYPKTRNTMQMLMRDLETLKEFSHSSVL
ncbi:PHD finger protein 20 isoform X2 [Diorhabda sublineata]|uniref:PHD finger protein 20 isoform X2 n=1 Tax=Diorhabda sublineata TaxID=1163346 RepID=UPI0024E07A5F|nr:PHD finger protein 20 isoform X2 [Diorhabda sublineata]